MMEPARPYQLTAPELAQRLDEMVAVTFADLTSQFMVLPRGDAFLTYETFRDAYETLRHATEGFAPLTPDSCWKALRDDARALIVLRTILGMSPPEWRDLTAEEAKTTFPSIAARTWTER